MRAVLIGMAAMGLVGCNHAEIPKSTRYILDSGSTGWIKIRYNRPDGNVLRVEDGVAVMHIQPGITESTKTSMSPTWEKSEFYYQSPDGKLTLLSAKDGSDRRLWGMEKTSDQDGDRETFFVGLESQFTHTSAHIDRITSTDDLRAPVVKALTPEEPVSEEERMKVLTALPK